MGSKTTSEEDSSHQVSYMNPIFQPAHVTIDEENTEGPGVAIDMKSVAIQEEGMPNPEEQNVAGWLEVFRYATVGDTILCIIGTLGAVAHGVSMPLLCWIFGLAFDEFVDPEDICPDILNTTNSSNFNLTAPDIGVKTYRERSLQAIVQLCQIFAMFGAGSFVGGFIQSLFWNIAAEHQVMAIRKAYFRSLMRQDAGWYDTQKTGAMTSRFIEDIRRIHRGIGDKIGLFVQHMTSFIGCAILGLYVGWQLCLVMLALTPINLLSSYLTSRVAFSQSKSEANAYSKAGAIAQEVLSSIRTVTAFGKQAEEVRRYKDNLAAVKTVGIRNGLYTGLVMGGMYFFLIGAYAIGFAYAVFLINDSTSGFTIGKAALIIWAVIEGTYALGTSLSAIQAFSSCRFAAYHVFKVADRVPTIDPYSTEGIKCEENNFVGSIEFVDVSFSYPTRKDAQVLNGVSLTVEPGSSVALVGASGCGKSTVIQLLQRYYDPDVGQVKIDGSNIRDYNITSFRKMIGSVSQEPILFSTTIYENIRYGLPSATNEEIEAAAKLANAHDFIMRLPSGYETLVGDQGSHMSGGQKQRIAIARALVRNPRILLLDEATSALDTESEAVVQDALDRARLGRTTIVIAHRLSTIMNAEKIIVMDKGQVREVGTHTDLVARQGVYAKLVEAQQGSASTTSNTEDVRTIQERRRTLANLNINRVLDDSAAAEEVNNEQLVIFSSEKKKKKDAITNHYSSMRLWKMASKELPLYLLGTVGAVICGAVWPIFAIITAKILQAYGLCTAEERYQQALQFVLIELAIAGGSFFGYLIMYWMFAIAGESVVLRVRVLAFRAMLRQDIAWFDDPENSAGALTSRLARQTISLKDATGSQLGQMVQIVAGITTALIIAFYHDWRVAFILVLFAALEVLNETVHTVVFRDTELHDKLMEQSAKALAQATTNIRTVSALGAYELFLDQFLTPLQQRQKKLLVKFIVTAIGFGLVDTIYLESYAAGFYASSIFIGWGVTDFGRTFTAQLAIMYSSYFVAQANAMAPDQAKAYLGVEEIFKLLDRKPAITWEEDEQKSRATPADYSGKASFESVEFTYPNRKDCQVLRGLNLSVESGKTIALVGSSGGGKSTLIQLIQRFYDPEAGQVNFDEAGLPSLNLSWVRSNMALVSQEPLLFDRTIAENIAYGSVGETTPTQQEMEAVAKMANIHNFIASLPDGYQTRVGERGSKLSGGQKQRVAIARALIRQPKVLLLDEATSALDSESEKVVQEAIDKAREGRTVLVVTHRLSTIEGADVIAVIQCGVICELGKHEDLIALKGVYYGLWSAQQLST